MDTLGEFSDEGPQMPREEWLAHAVQFARDITAIDVPERASHISAVCVRACTRHDQGMLCFVGMLCVDRCCFVWGYFVALAFDRAHLAFAAPSGARAAQHSNAAE